MKRYCGIVVFKFYKRIEIEAESVEEAKAKMREMEFNTDGLDAETEVYDLWEANNVREG